MDFLELPLPWLQVANVEDMSNALRLVELQLPVQPDELAKNELALGSFLVSK